MRSAGRLGRLFDLALLLYPGPFRERFGEEMRALFDDLVDEAGDSTRRLAAVVVRTILALPGGLFAAWRAQWATARRSRTRGSRQRGGEMLGSFWSDVKFGLRGLARSPAVTVLAVVSLALGLGANATLLSIVRGIIWSELPVREPEGLVRVFEGDAGGPGNFSFADYRYLRERSADIFEGLLVHDLVTVGFARGDRAEVIHGELVSANYFEVLGIAPAQGRFFGEADAEHPSSEPVVVLSDHVWRSRFGGDPSAVGQTVVLNGLAFRVVGIAPPNFQGTKLGLGMDAWIPVRVWGRLQGWSDWEQRRGSRWLNVVGRLRPGKGLDDARAASATVAARLAAEHPETNRDVTFVVLPEPLGNFGGEGAGVATTVGGLATLASALVLLVACGNVASLLLARGVERRREIGIRMALGAGRGRLVRQLLTEGLLVAVISLAIGLGLAFQTGALVKEMVPPLPYRFAVQVTPDRWVLGWMAAACAVAPLLFGLLPALRATRVGPLSPLLADGRAGVEAGGGRVMGVLAASTLALGCVTLVLSGLFIRSLGAARTASPGFETRGRAVASADVGLAGPKAIEAVRFFDEVVARLAGDPAVEAAAVASNVPLSDRQTSSLAFRAEDDDTAKGFEVWRASVSEGYFDVLGQPVVAGRAFAAADRGGAPVAIVSRALAERLWPGRSAVGERVRLGRGPRARTREVVGVVADARYRWIAESLRPALYLPFAQAAEDRAEIVALGRRSPAALPDRIEAAVRAVSPHVPVFGAKTLEAHVAGALWMYRLAASLSLALGVLAGALALAGLYGTVAFHARQRIPEIGVRLALGATRTRVVWTLVRRGARLVALGVGSGLLLAAGAAQVTRSLVFGVSTADPVTFLATAAAVCALALVACLLPAIKASGQDPLASLRAER